MCVFHAGNKMLEELWFAVMTCGTHKCELVAEFLQQNSKINKLTLICNNFIEEDGWEKLCSGLIASGDSLRTVTIEFTSEGDDTPEMVDQDLGQRIAERLRPVLEAKPCLTIHQVGLRPHLPMMHNPKCAALYHLTIFYGKLNRVGRLVLLKDSKLSSDHEAWVSALVDADDNLSIMYYLLCKKPDLVAQIVHNTN
jgi:hypothetical protein